MADRVAFKKGIIVNAYDSDHHPLQPVKNGSSQQPNLKTVVMMMTMMTVRKKARKELRFFSFTILMLYLSVNVFPFFTLTYLQRTENSLSRYQATLALQDGESEVVCSLVNVSILTLSTL